MRPAGCSWILEHGLWTGAFRNAFDTQARAFDPVTASATVRPWGAEHGVDGGGRNEWQDLLGPLTVSVQTPAERHPRGRGFST